MNKRKENKRRDVQTINNVRARNNGKGRERDRERLRFSVGLCFTDFLLYFDELYEILVSYFVRKVIFEII